MCRKTWENTREHMQTMWKSGALMKKSILSTSVWPWHMKDIKEPDIPQASSNQSTSAASFKKETEIARSDSVAYLKQVDRALDDGSEELPTGSNSPLRILRMSTEKG